MKRIALIVLVLLVGTTMNKATAQNKVVTKIIEIGTTDNQSMDHLDVLSNRIGGRLVGSNAYDNAVQWVASQFEEWGMEVEIDEAGEVPVGFNRGPWFGKLLGENGMDLHFATPSYTSGTKGVQRGHVMIEPKTQAQFDRMKGKLKGSWVLISGTNSGWPIDYSDNGDEARQKIKDENAEIEKKNNEIRMWNWENRDKDPKVMLPYTDEPALFYKEMVEAGIFGIVQSSQVPIRALYDRKNINNGSLTFDNLPTVPDIKLDVHQYKIIEQMAKERRYFQLEFDIRNHFRPGPVKFHNVIGIIRGSKYPEEYVLMGGHLDAFDVATGGVDCGSGITPAIEAARLIIEAGGLPKRSIVVCGWAAEEFGLLGSKSWVQSNTDKLPKIANYFNRDGGPTVASSLSVYSAMYDDFEKICKPLNSINPDFPFTLTERKPGKKTTRAGGSDHAYFAINGVPTLSFGAPDVKGYDFSYGEIWHTERDTYNMSIPEYQEHTAVVTAVVVYGVANLDHLLSREGMYIEE
jgi:carboxypeptidase Q